MPLYSAVRRRSLPKTTDRETLNVIEDNRVVNVAVITGRRQDGLSTLVSIDGTCPIVSSGVLAEAIGATIITGSSGFQQTGSTGAGSSLTGGGLAFLERQEPQDMEKGLTTFVTYFGSGFSVNFVLKYLLPRDLWADPEVPEEHPDVNIVNDDITVVDEFSATASVVVGASAAWLNDPVTEEPILGPVEYSFTGS